MNISARISNTRGAHSVELTTAGQHHALAVQGKASGGSSTNGGELLFLAIATCYCNDLYREARKAGIEVEAVDVEVTGEFGGEGEPAGDIRYSARVVANASAEDIEALMRRTDTVAEVHNTLRRASSVVLTRCDVQDSRPG